MRIIALVLRAVTLLKKRKIIEMSIVERPVCQVVKLFNIDDTSLLEDIKAVQDAAKKLIKCQILKSINFLRRQKLKNQNQQNLL